MPNRTQPTTAVTALDRTLAVPMFVVALLFLLVAGFLLPTLLYRDPHVEPAANSEIAEALSSDYIEIDSSGEHDEEIIYFKSEVRWWFKYGLLVLYLAIVAEVIAHWVTGGKNLRQHWLFLLVPFMRLSCRDHADGSSVWIIGQGWVKSTRLFERRLTDMFGIPMMVIALPVLPLILIQFLRPSMVNSNPDLKFVMATATAIIWVAFVFEFAIMFTVAKRKMKYLKEHWINLLIVVLPMFGFLRIAALGSMLKVKQLAKTVSVLRLRGLAIRLWRAVISLGILDKALRKTPDHRIRKIHKLIEDKEEELEILKWDLERANEAKTRFELKKSLRQERKKERNRMKRRKGMTREPEIQSAEPEESSQTESRPDSEDKT